MRRMAIVGLVVACHGSPPNADAGVTITATTPAPSTSAPPLPDAPPGEGAIVLVSKTRIMVGDDSVLALTEPRTTGIASKDLRPGDARFIVPLGAALDRFLHAGLPTHEATLIIDESTPYRIVDPVLHTLDRTHFTRFHFMVLKGAGDDAGAPRPSRSVHFSLPSTIVPAGHSALAFAVRIDGAGYTLSTAAAGIAPGCANAGSGVTIPLRAGHYDNDALGACARAVYDVAAGRIDDDVTLSPAMDVRYDAIIQAMDALAKDAAGMLFPEPRFAP